MTILGATEIGVRQRPTLFYWFFGFGSKFASMFYNRVQLNASNRCLASYYCVLKLKL